MSFKGLRINLKKQGNKKGIYIRKYVFVISALVLLDIVLIFMIADNLHQPRIAKHNNYNLNTKISTSTFVPALNQEPAQDKTDSKDATELSTSSIISGLIQKLTKDEPATSSVVEDIATRTHQQLSEETISSVPVETPTQIDTQPSGNPSGLGIAAGGWLTSFDQGKLNQYFELLVSLGVGWVRWDVEWSIVQENGPRHYNWEGTDRVAKTAQKYGIKSLAIITYTPKWARDALCLDSFFCAPADPKEFGRFAGEVASRYKDLITSWEIWNEPNLLYNDRWGNEANVGKYADVLRGAYIEIKKTNSSTIVMSGGLAPSDDNKNRGIAPLTFLKSLYATGDNKYFDAVALHPYSFPVAPKYNAEWNSWQQMYSIRQFMVEQGEGDKKIWVTEYGAPTGGPGTEREIDQLEFEYEYDYMAEIAQEEMVEEAVTIYNNNDWMGQFFWYSLKDNGIKNNTPENFFGLLRYDGSKKPAYDAFRVFMQNNR